MGYLTKKDLAIINFLLERELKEFKYSDRYQFINDYLRDIKRAKLDIAMLQNNHGKTKSV